MEVYYKTVKFGYDEQIQRTYKKVKDGYKCAIKSSTCTEEKSKSKCGTSVCESTESCFKNTCFTEISTETKEEDCKKKAQSLSSYHYDSATKKCYLAGNALTKYKETADKSLSIYNEINPPNNKIRIPGLDFATLSSTVDDDGYIYLPWLGQYIAAVYKFALVAASIVAVLIIIVQGMVIMMGAGVETVESWDSSGVGSKDKKNKALRKIGQVLIGLAIAWCSYTILYLINPSLVEFKSLKVKYIAGQDLNLAHLENINCGATAKKLSKDDTVKAAIKISAEVGIKDYCYMVAIFGKESGGSVCAVGYDSNYRGAKHVWARRDFLKSGKKYSGATFDPPFKTDEEYKKNFTKYNQIKISNDDKFDITNPPDYGLDWRFSYGFGLGQITLKDSSRCSDGTRGYKSGGKCYSIPELFSPEVAMLSAARLFKSNLACADKKVAKEKWTGTEDRDRAAFFAYGAGCGSLNKVKNKQAQLYDRKATERAYKYYKACKASK